MFLGTLNSPWSLWHFSFGVNQSDPGASSTTDHKLYRALGRLHGPWCKQNPKSSTSHPYCQWIVICKMTPWTPSGKKFLHSFLHNVYHSLVLYDVFVVRKTYNKHLYKSTWLKLWRRTKWGLKHHVVSTSAPRDSPYLHAMMVGEELTSRID